MKIRVLPEMRWPELGEDAADDDEVVGRWCEQVVATMQQAMDELVAHGGFGRIWPRRRAD